MITRFIFAFSAALSIMLTSPAQVIVIDSFEEGPFTLAPTSVSGGSVSVTGNPASIAGGMRDVRIQMEGNLFLPFSTASLTPGDGFLEYDRQQNGDLFLAYGAFISAPMNLNALAIGADRITLNLTVAPGPVALSLWVRDNSFFQNEQFAAITGPGPGTYEWPFSLFPAVEFDKLGGILLLLGRYGAPYNGPGLYRFENLSIPEPRVYAVAVGSGLLVFGALIRFVRTKPE